MLKCVLLTCVISITAQSSLSAQWIRANGPYGGQGGDIVVFGKSILASARDGVFESTDEGHSWVTRNNGLQISISVTTCYCLIAKENQLFLGTNFGLFRSMDSAKSWSFLSYNMALASKAVTHAIMIEGNLLMVGTAAGLLLSSDNGLTWQKSTRFNDTTVTAFAVVGSYTFAGTEHGLYLSSDTGRTWLDRTGILKQSIGHLFVRDSVIYASLADRGLFFSSDEGLNWNNVSSQFDNRIVGAMIEQGQNIFIGTDTMMFESKNGKDWGEIGPITMHSWIAGLALTQSGILCSSRNGVFYSTDSGVTWDHIVTCLPNTSGVNALVNVNGYLVAGTLEDGVFGSSDNGRHWNLCSMPPLTTFYSLATMSTRLIAATAKGILISEDSAKTWTTAYLNALTENFAIDKAKLYVGVYAGHAQTGVYMSLDSGVTWNRRTNGLPDQIPLAIWAQDSLLLTAPSDAGVFGSSDLGLNWMQYSSQPSVISFLSVGSNLFAAARDGVFLSTDGGLHWTFRSQGLPYTDTPRFIHSSVLTLTCSGANLFASVYGNGVFLSQDSGKHWVAVNEGLSDARIYSLIISGSDLLAGTDYGGGIWRRPLSEMIGQAAVHESPRSTVSLRIYPNPTASSTTITFTPEAAGHAEIAVVNMLGVEVARVFSGEVDRSERSVTWDAARMAAPRGMYEIVVRMGGKVQALPVIVK